LKKKRLSVVSAIVLILTLASHSYSPPSPTLPSTADPIGQGCTSFCLDNDGHCVFGTNFDNDIHEGLLYANKRNVSKTGWDPSATDEYAHWTSKYGSLTFNLVGYQLVWAGMNEAGLMLSTMALGESMAPVPDERPPLVTPLWLQYQLDNSSTVEEVMASASEVRLAAPLPRPADHYLVCDRPGDCAAIEFLEGKPVYHVGETLPVEALTNSTYEDSVRAWQTGSLPDNSLTRFGTAADRVTGFKPTDSESAVRYAFDTLAQVSSPSWTMWSIVFDPQNLQVHFRTKWNSRIRHIDFSKLDFSCGTPVEMLDIHEDLSGDVSSDFVPYSHDVSLDHEVNVLGKLGFETSRNQMEALLQQMERYPCVDGREHITQGGSPVSQWAGLVGTWAAIIVVVAALALLVVWHGARMRRRSIESGGEMGVGR
jgi:choloylglycine hydrolase